MSDTKTRPNTPAQTSAPAASKPTVKPATVPAQTGDKGEKKTRQKKTLVPLDFKGITVREATEEEIRAHRNTKSERDEDQVATDNLVRQAHEKWIAAGRPEMWNDSKGAMLTVLVPKEAVETFKTRVQRAGNYFSVAIRFGRSIEETGGQVKLVFLVKDRPAKQETAEPQAMAQPAATDTTSAPTPTAPHGEKVAHADQSASAAA